MDATLEQRIRERAYEIWTAAGRVDGQADAHWLAAERDIVAARPAPTPAKKAAATKPRSRATPTRAKPVPAGATVN